MIVDDGFAVLGGGGEKFESSSGAVRWRRSRYCEGANSTCVEVAVGPGDVGVRDSKNPIGPVLVFSTEEWQTFVRSVREGEFEC